MTEPDTFTSDLLPFDINLCANPGAAGRAATGATSPMLDPVLLSTASLAYLDALDALRARSCSGLRLGERHMLATKILGFATFGERDRSALTSRALAHFP